LKLYRRKYSPVGLKTKSGFRTLTVQQLINHQQMGFSKSGIGIVVGRGDGCGLSRAWIVSGGTGMKRSGLAVTGGQSAVRG
jgi:hypothetical protein